MSWRRKAAKRVCCSSESMLIHRVFLWSVFNGLHCTPKRRPLTTRNPPVLPSSPKFRCYRNAFLHFPCYTKTIVEFRERSRVWAEQKNGWFSRKSCYNASVPWPWPWPCGSCWLWPWGSSCWCLPPLSVVQRLGTIWQEGWVLVHHLVHLSEDCRRVLAGPGVRPGVWRPGGAVSPV